MRSLLDLGRRFLDRADPQTLSENRRDKGFNGL